MGSEVLYLKASHPAKELMLVPGGWHAAPLSRASSSGSGGGGSVGGGGGGGGGGGF